MTDAFNILRHVTSRRSIFEFLFDEGAQGLVEYALILAVVSVTVIVAMVFFRDQLGNLFSNIGNTLGAPGGPDPCLGQQQQGQCP
jgi:Flp pilus assembly pilin Flp